MTATNSVSTQPSAPTAAPIPVTPTKVVILGGSGFVGTRLTRLLLEQGHTVRLADLTPSETYPQFHVHCEITSLDSVIKACEGMDVIYNLAAAHRDDVRPIELYQQVNVDGSANVCKAADVLGIRRLVFTSSVAIYGMPDHELDETADANPFNEYGRTKWEAEKVYRAWYANADKLADTDSSEDPQEGVEPEAKTLIIIRPTVVFGEGNRGNFYNLLRQLVSGNFVMIGAGKNMKSVCYVENVAGFLRFILNRPTGYHLFNYVDKPDFDMNYLVSLVREKVGKGKGVGPRLPYALGYSVGLCFDALAFTTRKNFPISSIRVKKFCSSSRFSSTKAMSTGYKPLVKLDDAVNKTIDSEFGRNAKK